MKKKANEVKQQPHKININEQDRDQITSDILNKKALTVLDRIGKKLQGRDFNDQESLSVIEQVNKLIMQAISHENIAQSYLGWCPFW